MDDLTPLIGALNERQREAVMAPPAHRLVLAGAGSGKTRVLVHRIAWLVAVEEVSPFSILAVTFTNKAAAEMRQRIEQMIDGPTDRLWVGTFHGIAHRLLRMHFKEAKLDQNFQILDSDDQQRMLKRIIKGMNLDDTQWPARMAAAFINGNKDEGRRPDHLPEQGDFTHQTLMKIYRAYEEQCQRSSLVDFAELLLRAHELCRDNDQVLTHYRRRFQHILVDEFQDTNTLQYAWIRLLAGDTGKVFVVGDDDQSIYSWRGAKIDNMIKFSRDFTGAETIRLEQNYRSTGNILGGSNALIAKNSGRLGKELWTDGSSGEAIEVYSAFNDYDEVDYVIARIKGWINEGGRRQEAAILYRSNAQSRVFEEGLLRAEMPYRVYGGLRFFERAEIKDTLAYLRLIANAADDAAFERVINLPPRGIGATTVDRLRDTARMGSVSMWVAAQRLVQGGLSSRASNALRSFMDLIETLTLETKNLSLGEMTQRTIERVGLREHYAKEKGEKGEARLDNLRELINAVGSFEIGDDDDYDPLTEFLTHAALEAGERQSGEWDDCVQLMTLHSAKGLEFPLVFLVGVEEGLFPSSRTLEDANGLEEERRLCYVGMTRAMQKLYISHAESRRMHGREQFARPSRFIEEIPEEFVQQVRMQSRPSLTPSVRGMNGGFRPRRSASSSSGDGSFGNSIPKATSSGVAWTLGQRVRHGKFGEGTVLRMEGDGARARIEINFDSVGSKWLMAGVAKLEAA